MVVDSMSGEEPYIEHIESTEIKKLINRIYANKPEDAVSSDVPVHHHEDVVQQIDALLLKTKEPLDTKTISEK